MCKVFDGYMLRGLWEHQGGAPNPAWGTGNGRFPQGQFPNQSFEQLIQTILVKKEGGDKVFSG